MNLNKAIIIGRVTRDPETRTTPSGQQVANFGIATNRVWTSQDGQKQEKVEFHNIVAWRRLGEICGQYLLKGQLVMIEGHLETRDWEGQDGIKRTRTEIIAENMQMGPRPGGASARGPSQQQSPPKEEIPTIQADEPAPPENNSNEPNKEESKEEVKVENIPF